MKLDEERRDRIARLLQSQGVMRRAKLVRRQQSCQIHEAKRRVLRKESMSSKPIVVSVDTITQGYTE